MIHANRTLMTAAARVGYGARGFVYLLVGGLAGIASLDLKTQAVGTRGALRALVDQPFGAGLLLALAAGFACFAAWRLIEAVVDPMCYGSDRRGLGLRVALGLSALVYAAIACFAVGLTLGWDEPRRQGTALVGWVAVLLSAPLGSWIGAAVGLGVAGLGIAKMLKAWRVPFDGHLECGARIRLWAVPLSRFGLVARGLSFVAVGGSIVFAAYRTEADKAAGLGEVLAALERFPYGWILLAIAASGIAAFGLFGLLEAMYRRIDVRDID